MCATATTIFISLAFVPLIRRAHAADAVPKLPYPAGERFFLVQGYDTPPTHIKKDAYALDFTQIGCDAYGKAIAAAASGTVMFLSQRGYNGGYGTEVIVDHGSGIVSRYAHMVPDSIVIGPSAPVRRGEIVGRIGNTGLVSGAACADHPGTHLHFAMDTVRSDGTFVAYDPGAISGYSVVSAGQWYLSDNADDEAGLAMGDPSSAPLPPDSILGSSAAASSATAVAAIATATMPIIPPVGPDDNSSLPPAPPISPVRVLSAGGVSVVPSPPIDPIKITASGWAMSGANGNATDTDEAAATSTDGGADVHAGGGAEDVAAGDRSGTVATATGTPIFSQADDTAESVPSWYSDNWFSLGKGFSGTLNSLTLKGKTNGARYVPSQQFSLEEFKDASYTAMTNDFPLVGPWFIPEMATATFNGISVPLKPYFYYRLTTSESLQNGSIILAGTASTTTGTAMHNEFIYGTGRVEYTDPFFPFMVMEGVSATSTLAPPPLSAPTNIAANFDPLHMMLGLSFGSSTDPDWRTDPLHYEMNYSTSSMLDEDGWRDVGQIPLVFGNRYLIGIRARNNFGDVSAPATTTWDFPEGFSQYTLSPGLSDASQFFAVHETSTLRSIDIFVTDFGTSARNPVYVGCSLVFFEELPDGSLASTTPDNGFDGVHCDGDLAFRFASSSPVLYPGHHYHWTFSASTGNPSTGAGVKFYGTTVDTAGGPFSHPSLANARFVLTGDEGVIFSN